MTKTIFLTTIVLFVSAACFAQPTAPIKWQLYSARRISATALMPKLPTVVDTSFNCQEREVLNFASYADEAVFMLTAISKESSNSLCPNIKRFTESSFTERIDEIRNELKPIVAIGGHRWPARSCEDSRW